MINIKELEGQYIVKVEVCNEMYENSITFTNSEGHRFRFHHIKTFDEDVYIEEIDGDWDQLVYVYITNVESHVSYNKTDGVEYTHTTHKFETINGSVLVRWCGYSTKEGLGDVALSRLINGQWIG